jgi:competence protein ComEA
MRKKQLASIMALVGIVVFLVVAPLSATDQPDAAKAKAGVTQAADSPKAALKAETPEKINVNKADLGALSHIKGIGPETAQNIITYRKEVGNFEALEDLLKVKGIGEKTLQEIKPFISIH